MAPYLKMLVLTILSALLVQANGIDYFEVRKKILYDFIKKRQKLDDMPKVVRMPDVPPYLGSNYRAATPLYFRNMWKPVNYFSDFD